MRLQRGTVALVTLDPTVGHEQRGTRPCILVSDPEVLEHQRFPLVAVVPVTGSPGAGALYPRLSAGSGGLRKISYVLVDQVRSVDKARVHKVHGILPADELQAVDEGLRLFLGLD
ncbi:MAG: type II toxin-antitoxin system PemK/MazF family toxin [Gemmatimonadota bacterium]